MGRCRSCNGEADAVFDMGEMPLPNKLLTSKWDALEAYPLVLELCRECSLVQIEKPVAPEKMFSEYTYLTGCSGPAVTQAKHLVEQMIPKLPKHPFVVEIASNDGYLLDWYRKWDISVLGIEPAREPAEAATLKGIPTLREFFNSKLAERLPQADVIHANNVLAHVPDLNDFVMGVKHMLRPDGICVVEVQDLWPMLEMGYFDNIYHEHVYYFTQGSLTDLFGRHGMSCEIEPIAAHGGSLRCFVKHGTRQPHRSYDLRQKFGELQAYADTLRKDWHAGLRYKDYAGFGAAAKATVLSNWCHLDETHVRYIVDETPTKIGKFIPGTRIPVVSPRQMADDPPAKMVCFAWNYAEQIKQRFPQYDWIVPHAAFQRVAHASEAVLVHS